MDSINGIIIYGSFASLLFWQIAYKKGLAEQQAQFTPLPDPPDIEFAKKVTNQVSKVRK